MNMQTRAIAEKKKRKITVLILLLLVLMFLSTVSAGGVRHQIYSKASSSDEGIHSFFSDILEDAGDCVDKFIDESPDTEKCASALESLIKDTGEESRYYAAKGFESNVSWVVKPFSTLFCGMEKLTVYQSVFLTNYEILKNESDYSAYVNARKAVVTMRAGADEFNRSLDRIEPIELWNETSKLLFNATGLRDKLIDVYALINYYEGLLERYELEAPVFEEFMLMVAVSNEHPFVYEEITIYIYAKNMSSLALVIDNATYTLKNQTGKQRKKHYFEKQGAYDIYAEGTTINGKNLKSNIVKVYVSKIPTFIVLSSKYAALLNERVKISGLLVDYYDEPLYTANVIVNASEGEAVITDRKGRFAFYSTRSSEGYLNVSAFYPGSTMYENSSANSSIFFSRIPLSLHIESHDTNVNVNKTVNFIGSVSGISPNYTIPLNIIVNDTSVMAITAENDFDFALSFSLPGTYEVYSSFPCDSLYKPAKSNTVTITVTEKAGIVSDKRIEDLASKIPGLFGLIFNPRSLLFVLVALVSFIAGMYVRGLKRKDHHFGDKFIAPISSFFAGIYARTFKRVVATVQEKRATKQKAKPADSQKTEIAERAEEEKKEEEPEKVSASKGRSIIQIFIAKFIDPISLILTNLYAHILKRNNPGSESEDKGAVPESAENLGLDAANSEMGNKHQETVPIVDPLDGMDLGEAYKLLFDTIINQYGLKKSVTPRELLAAIRNKNEPFTTMLDDVTEIYEKVYYGNRAPADGEEERYIKQIGEILRYFKG